MPQMMQGSGSKSGAIYALCWHAVASVQ